ncbi:MAG: SUF system NifU family Fe-S cluster assembly protein [Gammaproteobacteria bacterium]|nr:SUF system NifU family Fe-S cluster assembly protein [Gammaproteobacteria bacterium]
MPNISNLYREVIMDHYKNPRNKGLIDDDTYVKCHLKNPSCGDVIDVESKVVDGVVVDVRHDGQGCSICCACASIMSEYVIGKRVDEVKYNLSNYLKMVSNQEYDTSVELDELEVFDGVKDYPARVRCASISSQALLNTLEEEGK